VNARFFLYEYGTADTPISCNIIFMQPYLPHDMYFQSKACCIHCGCNFAPVSVLWKCIALYVDKLVSSDSLHHIPRKQNVIVVAIVIAIYRIVTTIFFISFGLVQQGLCLEPLPW
jgi:hypothetical protein